MGVGASAGGLEAFKRLLRSIPENSGMAYVLVQHLNPSHESILTEILSHSARIPIHEITDDIKLVPDNIYVIPSNKILTAVDGKLSLTARDKKKLNHSIDIFFKSLAEVHREFAIGIVLSGTGSDGSLGLKAIKENGGHTFAQDGQTAAYEGMPQSAMDTGIVDFIMTPEEIPAQLLHVSRMQRTDLTEHDEETGKDDEYFFRQIIGVLRQHCGIDFTYYKQATIRRRIVKRVMHCNKGSIGKYLDYLRKNKEEQASLFQNILIPVTSFFRDPKIFQVVKDSVLPALYKNRSETEPLRIWVAACSTGEEAFSLAICLHEFLPEKFSANKIQIFATDISEEAISKARKGIYSKEAIANISEEQLANYFTKANGSYQVKKHIRDVCVFAVHNFLKDPPFARIDMVSCRNVLIYMDNFLQKKALTIFHYALRQNGFLLLGKSETTGTVSELFAPFSRNEKIYSRKQAQGRFIPVALELKQQVSAQKQKHVPEQVLHTDFRKSAEEILLSKHTPAGVIINDQMDIVHFHGNVADFLEHLPGKPTLNLIKMAREGLGFELRNVLSKARSSKNISVKESIPVKKNGKRFTVGIEVIPLANTVEPHFLVLFHQVESPASLRELQTGETASHQGDKLNEALTQLVQMEGELAQTREDMRTITEEQEAVNEELQSANQELLSSGEELQSLNEELETSKEELQSSNEELTVVNQELIDKQEQLSEALAYTTNIIATIRNPFIILDKALRIKSANASFYKKFNLTASETEGKLFYELQDHQWDDNVLRNLLESILPGKTQIFDFEIVLNFPSVGERTMLMNARQIMNEDMGRLILLAIEDITERKLSESKIEESEKQFRQLAETIPLSIWIATPNGKINYANSYLLKSTGYTFDELKNDNWYKLISPIDLEKTVKKWEHAVKEEKIFVNENRMRHHSGNYCWHKTKAIHRKGSNGQVTGWVGVSVEIEEEKVEEKRKDDFINIASHELNSPITNLKGYIEIIRDMYAKTGDAVSNQLFDKVSLQMEKLTHLVGNLLDVTQIKEEQVRLDKSRFNIDELISEVGDAMQAGFKTHRIVADLHANKYILADKQRIEQVLTNLISNAMKYSPQADKVHVTSHEDNGIVTICVQDFGIGVSKKMQPSLFKRYFRVEDENTYNGPGLGLGLYIVSEIVKLHGGTITIESEINKGSTFCFSIAV